MHALGPNRRRVYRRHSDLTQVVERQTADLGRRRVQNVIATFAVICQRGMWKYHCYRGKNAPQRTAKGHRALHQWAQSGMDRGAFG